MFFDIDGTLLTDNRTVSASTIQAINQLKEAGYLVGLATGRGPSFSLLYMVSLNLDLAVCYNGQYIVGRQGVITEHPLPVESLKALIDYAQKKNRDLSFGTASDVVGSNLLHVGVAPWVYGMVNRIPNWMVHVLMTGFNQGYRRLRPKTRASMLDKIKKPVYQVIMLASKKETDRLSPSFPQLAFTRSSPFAADVVCQGMSKLKGIELVAQKFGFSLEQVMAFGDSDNDLEMLAGVGHGIAMGNAKPQVKAVATYVTASNNQSGIAKALMAFKLIKGGEKND